MNRGDEIMPYFIYGTTTIEYDLEYSQNKDISIVIEWQNGVKVTAPFDIDEQKLNSALHMKAPWILNKWNAFNEIADKPAPKEFVSGEKFTYIGRNYRLKVRKTDGINQVRLSFNQGRYISEVPSYYSADDKNEELYQAFKKWYIEHGDKKITDRLAIYTTKMNVAPTKVILKEQKMRWGSCTTNGTIYLNWHIIMAPISIIDYLLVHELAHLKHPNHSKDFWGLIRTILPDYQQRKEWLRINGPKLTIDYNKDKSCDRHLK